MGYYTQYAGNIYSIGNEEKPYKTIKEIIKKLEEITDYYFPDGFFEGELTDEIKWYDCEEDMIKLSELYPNLIFEIEGHGEDRDDNWLMRVFRGKVSRVDGEIVYPDFNPSFNEEVKKARQAQIDKLKF